MLLHFLIDLLCHSSSGHLAGGSSGHLKPIRLPALVLAIHNVQVQSRLSKPKTPWLDDPMFSFENWRSKIIENLQSTKYLSVIFKNSSEKSSICAANSLIRCRKM